MELDDLKQDVRRLAASPDGRADATDPSALIERLRQCDATERRRKLRMAGGLVAVGCAFVATGTAGRTTLGVAMLLIALYFGLYARWFARVRYDEPSAVFLERALRRYAYWRWQDSLAAVPLLTLLFLGGARVVEGMADRHLETEGARIAEMGFVVFFAGLVLAGFVLGRRNWRRQEGPLIDELTRLRDELRAE